MGSRGRGSGTGKSTVTADQQRAIDKIAKQTRDLKNEQYRIVGEDGQVKAVSKGQKHEVGTTVGEKRDKVPGSVTIHNHPSGGTFSSADFSDFGYGARAIYAAAPEGTYSLANTKYGKKDAKAGWVAMREAYENSEAGRERGFMELKKAATSTARYQKAAKAAETAAQRYMQARNAGKPQATLDKLMATYNTASQRQSAIYKEELRNAEVRPAHEWLKANAKKYGFKYSFTRR